VSRTAFRPDVCCKHVWMFYPDENQTCDTCGATCKRGPDGTIEEYDAGVWTDYAGGEQ